MSDAVVVSAITAGATVVVAVVGSFGGRAIVRGVRGHRVAEVEVEEREAVEAFANDPGKWVSDVLKMNATLVAEVEGLRKDVKDLREAHDRRDKRERRFLAAISRWLVEIARAWNVETDMPYPREEDREVLAEVIPVMVEATRPRRRPRSNGQTA